VRHEPRVRCETKRQMLCVLTANMAAWFRMSTRLSVRIAKKKGRVEKNMRINSSTSDKHTMSCIVSQLIHAADQLELTKKHSSGMHAVIDRGQAKGFADLFFLLLSALFSLRMRPPAVDPAADPAADPPLAAGPLPPPSTGFLP
jgi:hypothetical protein